MDTTEKGKNMPMNIATDFRATRDEVLIRRITAGETHLFPKLVEPYVRAASAVAPKEITIKLIATCAD